MYYLSIRKLSDEVSMSISGILSWQFYKLKGMASELLFVRKMFHASTAPPDGVSDSVF